MKWSPYTVNFRLEVFDRLGRLLYSYGFETMHAARRQIDHIMIYAKSENMTRFCVISSPSGEVLHKHYYHKDIKRRRRSSKARYD